MSPMTLYDPPERPKISPKGFVEPVEMPALCEKIRELLADERNVYLQSDWEAMERFTTLLRCFTFAERDLINNCYGRLKRGQKGQGCQQKKAKANQRRKRGFSK